MKSPKPKAYVYKLTHKVTKQFYYGYRFANIKLDRLAIDDLGFFYKTSSKEIDNLGFDEFDFEIIKEFECSLKAYWYEQGLIGKNWYNPLLLNGHFIDKKSGEEAFRQADASGSNNGAYNDEKFHWYHKDHGEVFATQYELRIDYNLKVEDKGNLCNVSQDKKHTHKGWGLFKNLDSHGNFPSTKIYDYTIYEWHHPKYGTVSKTIDEMVADFPEQKLNRKFFPLVIKKQRREHKGWCLVKQMKEYADIGPWIDRDIHHWHHEKYKTFIGTRRELINKFPKLKLWSGPLGAVIRKEYTNHKGWTIKN